MLRSKQMWPSMRMESRAPVWVWTRVMWTGMERRLYCHELRFGVPRALSKSRKLPFRELTARSRLAAFTKPYVG